MDAKLLTPNKLSGRGQQKGYVIIIALVVLIVMTLSGLALIRTAGTSYQMAGNLAFHQSTIQAADRSTEAAMSNFLIPNNVVGNTTLHVNNVSNDPTTSNAYFATRADPAANQTWDAFWNASLQNSRRSLGVDAAGNTVEYVIHRLCETTGLPAAATCAVPPTFMNSGGSQTSGGGIALDSTQVYYRITTRVTGPRNTVAFTQTMVLL